MLEEAFNIISSMSPFGEDVIKYHFHTPRVSGKEFKSVTSNFSMEMLATNGDNGEPIVVP